MLPEDFINITRTTFGEDLWQICLKAFDEPTPASIRLNTDKIAVDGIACGAERVAWCDNGYYLKERPQFTFDPLMHAGAYYVQEASSMFLHHVMKHIVGTEQVVMIDMCAAPGGKSTAASTVLPKGSLLVSNEPVPQRASILAENIQKWGIENVVVTNNLPQNLSRTGVRNVEKCCSLQREIVSEAWQCLKQGGTMIYSTCTFNTRENEENVKWICENLDADIVDIPTEKEWNITGSLLAGFDNSVYRFIPGMTRGEGLFMAVLRKNCDCTQRLPKMKLPATNERLPEEWIEHPENYIIENSKQCLTAMPKQWYGLMKHLSSTLKVVHQGIRLGTMKGRDIIPDQCLALSTALRRDAFTQLEIDRKTATDYLRKEAVTLPADIERGFVLLTYMQMPLGFVKNLGNRANNLYPAEWRIKTTHIPENVTDVIGQVTENKKKKI